MTRASTSPRRGPGSRSRPHRPLTARLAVAGGTTVLLLGLVAVALPVGGIGIANVVVISVLERRGEIGLRRALCAGSATLLARVSRIRLTDALMGLIPGGSAAIVASAEEMGADSRVVAFAQYLRVGLVALSAPLIVASAQGPIAAPPRPAPSPRRAPWSPARTRQRA